MTTPAAIPEPDYPYPPRYWWLKRIFAACGVMLLLLVGVRLVWGWDANRRLQKEITSLRARGEPVFPQEFANSPAPDSENYAVAIQQAVSALNLSLDSPSSSTIDFHNYPPYPPQWYILERQAVAGQPAVFSAVRAARTKEKSYWNTVPSTEGLDKNLDSIIHSRQLANLLVDAAVLSHLSGDDTDAIAKLFDTLRYGRALESHPSVTGFLTGLGIESLAVERTQVVAPEMSQSLSQSTRSEAIRLIVQLLDNSDERVARALQADRAYTLDFADRMNSESVLLNPLFRLDLRRSVEVNAIATSRSPIHRRTPRRLTNATLLPSIMVITRMCFRIHRLAHSV